METPREYYYTYYSYEEYGMGYFGSRKCYCRPEEDVKYFGSFRDKYFKPTQKIILKDDYNTREEALVDEIILHDYYDVANNPHFANKAKQTSTKFSFGSNEHSKKIGKDNFLKNRGIFGLSKEQKSENSRKSGLQHKENKTGFCGMSAEKRSELGRKNSLKNKKNKIGIFKMTSDELSKCVSKGGTKTNSQKWKCLITGHISNPGGLSRFQNKRGIDKSLREMVLLERLK